MSVQNRRAMAGWRWVAAGALPLFLLGCSFVGPMGAMAQERTLDRPLPGIRLDHLATGYEAGGTLGFALRETTIAEQLYRRTTGAERGVIWSAQFVSRWPLNEGQLDRWSAQAIGLLTDELGAGVQLAGWERLDASDVGDQRVAYRYTLASSQGERLGEATIVVFARGDQVGLAGEAAIGGRSPIDAAGLARVLDGRASGS